MAVNISRSLSDIAGESYTDAVCRASAALGLGSYASLKALADEKVDFFPDAFAARAEALALRCGEKITDGLADSFPGAPTNAFAAAFHRESAPLSGLGAVRVGENGKIAFIGKSEHYQASLGHAFPGFRLLENAARIGITNATHNNTRGMLTRRLERELIRTANGIAPGDDEALEAVLRSKEKHVLNRVINLETGSLACEAAFKMALARFYRLQQDFPEPPYAGRIPVFVVMADSGGGKSANYHGTTILTQMLRGLWPELCAQMENAGLMRVAPCGINDLADFRRIVEQYDSGKYKIALFLHELVLMNYAGIRLSDEFVSGAHALCDAHDIPVLVDEIQSCMWSPELFLFREYEITPDFVSVGKGFPGGEYPASKILTSRKMDTLNQFGALVTNGQEELASLAYLVTIAFAEHNAAHIGKAGAYYHTEAQKLLAEFPTVLRKIEGDKLMTSFVFAEMEAAVKFVHFMNEHGFDVSAQTYKANCPAAALTKLPLIVTEKMIDLVISSMREALKTCVAS